MNRETQLQLQAYLDGELAEAEVRTVETRLRDDAAAREHLAGLRQTRSLLVGGEIERALPESREFYWSKIARQIGREAARSEPVREPGRLHWLRRLLLPVGSSATALVVLIAGLMFFSQVRPESAPYEGATDVPETEALTFRDQQAGVTVVWFSYHE